MNHSQSGTEKLTLLATGLITALVVHLLFSIAGVASAFSASNETFLLGLLKALRLVWNLAGIVGAGYLIVMAIGMIKGRHFTQARTAALGAIFLPLLGSHGLVSAFALLPIGLAATYLLKQTAWQSLFLGGFPEPAGEPQESLVSEPYEDVTEPAMS